MTILLNYHIGRIVLGSMCVGVSVWLGWSGIRVAGFSFGVVGLKWYPCCRLSFLMCSTCFGLYPSSGACDCSVELPHWSYCSWFDVCWSFVVVGLEWYPCCRLQFRCGWVGVVSVLQAEAASDIKLVFYSSTKEMK